MTEEKRTPWINTTQGQPNANPGINATTTVTPKQQRMSNVELFHQWFEKPQTKEDQEEEAKKYKRNLMFASIGDGISALSNLFFTTRGAPSSFNAQTSASKKMQERWDKLQADRKTYNQQYIQGLMNARRMDDDYNNAERSWKQTLERAAKEDEWRNKQFEQQANQWQQTFDFNKEKAKQEQEFRERQFQAQQENARNSNAVAWANVNASKAKAKKPKYKTFKYNGKTYKIPEEMWNTSYQSIYNRYNTDRDKSYDDAENWVWGNINNPSVAEALIGLTDTAEDFDEYIEE